MADTYQPGLHELLACLTQIDDGPIHLQLLSLGVSACLHEILQVKHVNALMQMLWLSVQQQIAFGKNDSEDGFGILSPVGYAISHIRFSRHSTRGVGVSAQETWAAAASCSATCIFHVYYY